MTSNLPYLNFSANLTVSHDTSIRLDRSYLVKQWPLLGYACDMDVKCTLMTTQNGTDIGALCGPELW